MFQIEEQYIQSSLKKNLICWRGTTKLCKLCSSKRMCVNDGQIDVE